MTLSSMAIPARPQPRGLIATVIPTFNEEETIAKVILKTRKFVDEVMVCEDGSTDDTAEITRTMGAAILRHQENEWKGETMRSLMSEAMKRDLVVAVTLDADDPLILKFLTAKFE